MNEPNIKALIIDDEALSADMLEYLVQKNAPAIKQIKKATSAVEGLEMIRTFKPDLLFLDIQMPFISGFELLSKISKYDFSVIFTTAYNKYAIRAIRFSALDYLLKPVDAEELKEAVNRYLEKRSEKQQLQQLYENFQNNLNTKENKDYRLALHTHNGLRMLSPFEIVRCEGHNNYTHFHMADNSTIVASKTIKEYEEILSDYGFLRVHKSHLLNATYIVELTLDHRIILKDKMEIEVSRRRRSEVLEALKKPT
ncbi:MAG: LytTR family DNA-binding domain-containing protein [Chitinophagaceae bacterium]